MSIIDKTHKAIRTNIERRVKRQMPNKDWFGRAKKTENEYIAEFTDYAYYFINEYGPTAIEKNKSQYENGEIGMSVTECIGVMCETYEAISGIDLTWLTEEINNKYDRRIQTEDKALKHGCYVDNLVTYGSSKIQSINAIADWLCISPTSIRDAYYSNTRLGYNRTKDEELHGTLIECLYEENITRPFPVDYPKALDAYIEFSLKYFNEHIDKSSTLSLQELDSYFQQHKSDHYISKHFETFKDSIPCNKR